MAWDLMICEYDLRHTCVTLLMAAGKIQDCIRTDRHASVTLTLGTYSHTMTGMHEEATSKIRKLIY
jgi:integrase